ncbi:MAG: TolC family protein, partial [Myxococcales bacterium]|nr:TolC family protein [Myxococcales bacterium]
MLFATHAHFRIVPILLAVAFTANAEPEMDAVPEEGATESATMPEPAVAEDADEEATEIKLSLRSAVNLAIENNLGVEVARHAPLIAEQDMSIAWSAYDPTFAADMTYSNVRAQPSDRPQDADFVSTAGTASVGGLIPLLGASLSLEYAGERSKFSQTVLS